MAMKVAYGMVVLAGINCYR